MDIIYSGGWNNSLPESIQNSFVYTYADYIKEMVSSGKKAVFITLAKPDGYYDKLLKSACGEIEIINSKTPSPNWSLYDGLFIPGGNPAVLKKSLKNKGFQLNKLKKTALVLGDSAGSYILSSFFYSSPPGEKRGKKIKFLKGFNPQAKVITIAHTNNPFYCNQTLISKVEDFARKKGLYVLKLAENEQKVLFNGKFIKVNLDQLFLKH